MTNEFGKVDDKDGQNTDGNGQESKENSSSGITSEDLEALQTRDVAAQAHIPQLESENKELRDKVVDLETSLANATSLDEVMKKITDRGDGTSNDIDAGAVTQIVERALDQRQTKQTQEDNWTSVMNTLTELYGDWKTADTKVQERAKELDIELDDVTTMAKNNPKAFLSLFKTPTASSDSSSGVRSAGSGQKTAELPSGNERDAAFYKKMRIENPKQYWSLDTQAQFRRDIHGAT